MTPACGCSISRRLTVDFPAGHARGVGEETALVSSGVEVGDQVVALGAQLLHEGDSVRVDGEETASR